MEWLTEWGLTPAEAVVYGYLYGWLVARSDQSLPFRQTQAEMAKAVGMKERMFKNYISHLISYGCITTERNGETTNYKLHARILYKNKVQDIAPSAKNCTDRVQDVAPTECKILHREGVKNCTDRVQDVAPTTFYNIDSNISISCDDAHAREEEEIKNGVVKGVDELAGEVRKEVEQGGQIAESAQRLYGIMPDVTLQYLALFVDKLRMDGTNYKSRSDFRRHFNNWLRIQMENLKKQNNGQQHGVSDEFIIRTAREVAANGGLAF